MRLLQIITRNGSLDDGRTLHEVIADALLAAGWTRGGAEAGRQDLISQARALLSINASGSAVPRVPGLAVEIIERLIAALARPSAPETLAWAVEVDGEIEWVDLFHKREIAESVAKDEGGKPVRVAIRVVEDGGD